jgi:hypothetical protein
MWWEIEGNLSLWNLKSLNVDHRRTGLIAMES